MEPNFSALLSPLFSDLSAAAASTELPNPTGTPNPNNRSINPLEDFWASYYVDHNENAHSSAALRKVVSLCRGIGITGPRDFAWLLEPDNRSDYEALLNQFSLLDKKKVQHGFLNGAVTFPALPSVLSSRSMTLAHPSSSAIPISHNPKQLKCVIDRATLAKRLKEFSLNHRTNQDMAAVVGSYFLLSDGSLQSRSFRVEPDQLKSSVKHIYFSCALCDHDIKLLVNINDGKAVIETAGLTSHLQSCTKRYPTPKRPLPDSSQQQADSRRPRLAQALLAASPIVAASHTVTPLPPALDSPAPAVSINAIIHVTVILTMTCASVRHLLTSRAASPVTRESCGVFDLGSLVQLSNEDRIRFLVQLAERQRACNFAKRSAVSYRYESDVVLDIAYAHWYLGGMCTLRTKHVIVYAFANDITCRFLVCMSVNMFISLCRTFIVCIPTDEFDAWCVSAS